MTFGTTQPTEFLAENVLDYSVDDKGRKHCI